jgi:hypothetical protein
LGPGQAELAGEGDERALVVVLAGSGGVFDPAGVGEGVDGLRASSSTRRRAGY